MRRYSLGSGRAIPLLISRLRRVCPSVLHQLFLLTWVCFTPETPAPDRGAPLAEPTEPQGHPLPPQPCPTPSSHHLWDIGFARRGQDVQRGRWHRSARESGALAGSPAEDRPDGESRAGAKRLKHLVGWEGFVFTRSLSFTAEIGCRAASPARDPPEAWGKMPQWVPRCGGLFCETFPVDVAPFWLLQSWF